MKIIARLYALVLIVILSACTLYNPLVGRPDPKTMPAEIEPITPTLAVRTVWSVNLAKSEGYEFSPAYWDKSVYAASEDGGVVKINLSSGQKTWQINAGVPLTAGVAVSSNVVVVAGKKGLLLAFDINGNQLWKIQTSSEIYALPVAGKGVVIVRSVDNKIAAYDLTSGNEKWVIDRPLPSLILRNVSGASIVDDMVVVGLPGGRMVSLSLNTGVILWDAAVGEPKGATELERIADVSGKPVVVGEDVCAVAYQSKAACFGVKTGKLKWEKKISSEVGLDVDELYVFAADVSGGVHAYARDGGSSAWRNDKLLNRHLSAPISFGRSVAVGDFEGYVHFLSRSDGSVIARVATDGSQILASPIVADSNLIVQTKSGAVVAIATE